MKTGEQSGPSPDPKSIEDVVVISSKKRWARRHGKWLALIVASALAAFAWAANYHYFEPQRDEQRVLEALAVLELEADSNDRPVFKKLRLMPTVDKSIMAIRILRPNEKSTATAAQLAGYESAIRIAVREGIPEGKLEFGRALRDGSIGDRDRDSTKALKVFNEVARDIEAGVRVGDPVAMIVRAQVLGEGLGVEPDTDKAVDLARRAGAGLEGVRLQSVAMAATYGFGSIFKDNKDLQLAGQLATRMIEKKMEDGPSIGAKSCGDFRKENYKSCTQQWYQRGATAGITAAMAPYAESLLEAGEPLETVASWFAAGDAESSSEQRYQHAVVRAILAKTEQQLVESLSAMWMQVKANGIEAKAVKDRAIPVLSLDKDFFGLWNFEKIVTKLYGQSAENFFIALRVRGLLTGSLDWLQAETDPWFDRRPWLKYVAESTEVSRKSKIIAQALKDGSSLASISLKVPTEVPIAKSRQKDRAANFSFEDATAKSAAISKPKDSEEQDKTGYLKGQSQLASGGLSNFTVDNQQGSGDAVARIYLNGEKPSVRSMYVKQGETFTAKSLMPGTYVFRYRFIGSDDTYESDNPFALVQTKTEAGTRYSNITVTLFRVKDGNMQTRKVDSSKF